MMCGSENSFGLGGYYKTPVEQVLPLISRFEKEKEKPSMAMVLVIDKSGSMEGLPISLARQAAKASVELLSHQDQVGIVAFDSQPTIVCEIRHASDTAGITASIDRIGAGGGTFMYAGMSTACDMLRDASARIKHMIVLGDGQTQPADHERLISQLVDMRVTVSTVALGPQADQNLMARIAQLGNGRYYATMDPANVPQIFTRETMQAARSAIKEDLYACVQIDDHPILAGYEDADLPFVFGYVMTQPKPTGQILLATESGDPLLAFSRYGLGVGLAYTSDLTEKWGGEWLSWSDFGSFWAQVLRSLVREDHTPGFEVESTIEDNLWSVGIARHDQGDRPITDSIWEAKILDSEDRETAVHVRATGLGRYDLSIPLHNARKLALRLYDKTHDALQVLYFSRPYPEEYRLHRKPDPHLAGLQGIEPEAVRDNLPSVKRRQSIKAPLAFAALACLLVSVFLRRI